MLHNFQHTHTNILYMTARYRFCDTNTLFAQACVIVHGEAKVIFHVSCNV